MKLQTNEVVKEVSTPVLHTSYSRSESVFVLHTGIASDFCG